MVTTRSVDLPDDQARILAIDRSFVTDRVYRIERSENSFSLAEQVVKSPLRKELPLEADADFGDARNWDQGLVAVNDQRIVGFAAFTHQEWNKRTDLWHLYVAPDQRGQGVGRALINVVVDSARSAETRCIWLETSTVNYPAIQFYRHIGFALCGLDASLYDPIAVLPGETALYFALALAPNANRS